MGRQSSKRSSKLGMRDTWLAQSVEHATLDVTVVNSSLILDGDTIKKTLKNKSL